MSAALDNMAAAVAQLRQGGLVVYPTEGVLGLGCDPGNPLALARIISAKRRPSAKGFILIGAHLSHFDGWIAAPDAQEMATIEQYWPGPTTLVLRSGPRIPEALQGAHQGIAVRLTAHPIAAQLCREFGGALVSTSANLSGQPPVREQQDLDPDLCSHIDAIVLGACGALTGPTPVLNAKTQAKLR